MQMMPHVLQATVLSQEGTGEDVFIPRIPLIPTDMPFKFKRLQFPIRLCYSMSINKSQGQSMKVVGLNYHNHASHMVSSMWVVRELANQTAFTYMHLRGNPKMLYILQHYNDTHNQL